MNFEWIGGNNCKGDLGDNYGNLNVVYMLILCCCSVSKSCSTVFETISYRFPSHVDTKHDFLECGNGDVVAKKNVLVCFFWQVHTC